MEEALSLKKLNERVADKYEYDERRVVGILLARYDLPITREIVDTCYLYWHSNTEKVLDFFWAGYGEYIGPNEESRDTIILKFEGNDTRIYYDRRAFISIKNEFNRVFKKPYKDKLQLILINYREGKLRFNEAMRIDLEENIDENFSTIRELVEYITNECAGIHDVADLERKLRSEYIKEYVKKQVMGITFSDVLSLGTGFVG